MEADLELAGLPLKRLKIQKRLMLIPTLVLRDIFAILENKLKMVNIYTFFKFLSIVFTPLRFI